ncbi:MAG: ABC transporter permease subunit [Cyanobacteria bacterium P01_F01_bin.53]
MTPAENRPDRSQNHPKPPNRRGQRRAGAKKAKGLNPRWLSAGSIFLALVLWFLVTNLKLVDPLFFPSPQSVWDAFINILQNGYKGRPLIQHIGSSMGRLAIAFVLALGTAVPIGLASGYFKPVQAILDPFIEFYRPLPPLAYYTLLVIWLGIEDNSKIALLFLAGFAPLYIAMVSGVRRVPRDRINAALSLGSSQWQVFTQIIFPSCLPELFTGLRTALGFMYTTLVAAEMVAAVSGIGWMVLDASKFLRSDIIFVGIIIMGIIAIALDSGLRWLQARYLPWVGRE